MKTYLTFLGFFILTSSVASQTVTVYGKCPNVRTGLAEIGTASFECAGLRQFGCILLPCPGSMQFSCRLPTESCRTSTDPVPLSTKIEFDTLKVDTPISFFINLNVTAVNVDFYLLADATRSMRAAISTVKSQFNRIIDHFNSDPLVTSVRYGVGIYRDESELDNGFRNLQAISPSTASAKAAINTIRAVGGRDVDEANLVGLFRVATDPAINWGKNTRKIVVYFGDYPGHEPSCGKYGTLTRQRVVAALKKKGITVIGMSLRRSFNQAPRRVFRCPGKRPAGAGQTSFITQATGGGNPLLTNPSAIVSSIIAKLKILKSTFSVDDSDCKGKLESTYSPTMPQTLAPGETKEVKQTSKVPRKYCNTDGTSPPFKCNLRYIEDGVFMPPTAITVKKIVGCPK